MPDGSRARHLRPRRHRAEPPSGWSCRSSANCRCSPSCASTATPATPTRTSRRTRASRRPHAHRDDTRRRSEQAQHRRGGAGVDGHIRTGRFSKLHVATFEPDSRRRRHHRDGRRRCDCPNRTAFHCSTDVSRSCCRCHDRHRPVPCTSGKVETYRPRESLPFSDSGICAEMFGFRLFLERCKAARGSSCASSCRPVRSPRLLHLRGALPARYTPAVATNSTI